MKKLISLLFATLIFNSSFAEENKCTQQAPQPEQKKLTKEEINIEFKRIREELAQKTAKMKKKYSVILDRIIKNSARENDMAWDVYVAYCEECKHNQQWSLNCPDALGEMIYRKILIANKQISANN